MCPFKNLGTLRTEQFHEEKHEICDVALDELINECRPLNLVQNRIYLVGLGTDVLKYVVYSATVKH